MVAPTGNGFEYATTTVLLKENPRLKLLYVNCIFNQGNKSLFVEVSAALSNIKIASLNYLRVDFDLLAKALWSRILTDLKEDVLVILDNIDALNLVGIKYLVSYLTNYKNMVSPKRPAKCGIMIRITPKYLLKVKNKSEPIYDALISICDDTKWLNTYSVADIKAFLTAMGLTNESLIADISKRNRQLRSVIKIVNKNNEISSRLAST
ncbi:MAG: hypothetical protein JNJ75_10660 [Cyclobacteriaceae bacterium]|nr:hypothetical protein [Cyclobacteriaceae bacterium]